MRQWVLKKAPRIVLALGGIALLVLGVAVAWADVEDPQPIVEDTFNGYTNGSVVGQGGWESYVNGDNFVVQDTTRFEGSKALHVSASGDSVVTKKGTPRSDGKQAVWVRTENRSQWGFYPDGNAQFRVSKNSWAGGTDIFAAVSFKSDGNVAYYDVVSGVYQNFAAYDDNEWTLVEIEWRSSDTRARYRVNEDTWTDWKPFSGIGPFTGFDYVGFDFYLPGGSGGAYFDTLGKTITDCPERLFGLYCPGDPSPVENPNLDTSGSSGGGGGGGGDGGGDEQPQPTAKKGQVKGAATISPKLQALLKQVPALFTSAFGRKPTSTELAYWRGRITRGKKTSEKTLIGAMGYQKSFGRTMPPTTVASKENGKVAGATAVNLVGKINAIFRSVYGRNPTPSENRYWLSRIKDKPTEQALKDAMLFHKMAGIRH